MISFNHFELDRVADDAAPKIAGFKQKLNMVSEDIKSLERLFRDSDVCLPYWIEMKNDLNTRDRYFVGWAKAGDKWRLYHHTSNIINDKEESHPLIEMSASVRLQAYPYLVKLLQHVADSLPDHPLFE